MNSISIIIPAYNADKYLDKCLTSLLHQTFKDFEVILIDDGSTDQTWSLIEKWSKKCDFITGYKKQNEGVSSARNSGIKRASGTFITFVDADDYVETDYLKNLITPYMNDNNVDLSIIGYKKEKEDGSVDVETHGSLKIMNSGQAYKSIFLDYGFEGYLFNKLFKHQVIKQKGIEFDSSITICEDLLFCCEYLLYVNKVCYNPESSYNYIVRSRSALTSRIPGRFFDKKWLTEAVAYEKIYSFLPKEFLDAVDTLHARMAWVYSYLSRLVFPAKNLTKSEKKSYLKTFKRKIQIFKPDFLKSKNYPTYDKVILIANLYVPLMIYHAWNLYLKVGKSGLKSK